MASQWFYARNGQRHGPVNSAQLTALAKSGQLSPADLIWKEGMTQWVPAGNSPQLFPKQALDSVAVQLQSTTPQISNVARPIVPKRERKSYRRLLSGTLITSITLAIFGAVYLLLGSAVSTQKRHGGVTDMDSSVSPFKRSESETDSLVQSVGSDGSSATSGRPGHGAAVNALDYEDSDAADLQQRARSIRPGMTDHAVLDLMGRKPKRMLTIRHKHRFSPDDRQFNFGYDEETNEENGWQTVRHAIHHPGVRMYWLTGPLGLTVHFSRDEDETLRVVFVSDADSGYYLSAQEPPPGE